MLTEKSLGMVASFTSNFLSYSPPLLLWLPPFCLLRSLFYNISVQILMAVPKINSAKIR